MTHRVRPSSLTSVTVWARSAAFILATLLLAACGDQKEGKEKARTIPLESVYSTTGQKNLKKLNRGVVIEKDGTRKYDEPYGLFLHEIHIRFQSGGSNVLLVRGKDITEAARATWEGLVGAQTFDRPIVPQGGSPDAPVWLVVYFGTTASDPIAWVVQSIEHTGSTIRLTFLQPKRGRVTKDLHQYLFWAPLGQMDPGTYALELFDGDKNEVRLLRRVTIAASKS